MLTDIGLSEFLTPLLHAGQREYLKNMLTDRGVRIYDTPIPGQREYLKNMLTDRVVRISDIPYCWSERISKKIC